MQKSNETTEKPQSLWRKVSKKSKFYPKLETDHSVDVVIVGAGITGLTAALELANLGKKVIVLEKDEVGSGTTGDSTGNLYIEIQQSYKKILDNFNEDTVKNVLDARKFAIDYIEEVVQTHQIDCNFIRRPWYFYTNDSDKIQKIQVEHDLLNKLGHSASYLSALPIPIKIKKAFKIDNQARMNPLQYVLDLADALDKKGVLIFENSPVIEFSENEECCIIKTEKGKVRALHSIIATHTPLGVNNTQILTAPYRSYVVGADLTEKFPDGTFWDCDKPHHVTSTFSVHKTEPDILLIAGSHHKTGQDAAKKHFKDLKKYLNKHYPNLEPTHHWSAQHYHAADGLPYIGLAKRGLKRTYMATGYFADGLVYGTLAGILLSKKISKEKNNWFSAFKRRRPIGLSGIGFVMKESSNVLAQYAKDLPLLSSIEYTEIKTGEAKVIEKNGEKVAVFRDEGNKLHAVSAVCTHMKGIVNWNNAEKTWDCPCHGSRFSMDGKVIEGPAMFDLEKRS